MSERVHVVVRIRPFLPADPEDADLTTLIVDDTHVCCGSRRVFRVDRVYKMEDDTAALYKQSVRPLVEEFLRGFNCTVMAYGQTGTGKTFTIAALLPLILGQVVNEGFHGSTEDLSFQYIEVYGDSLRDLLSDDPVESAKQLHIYDAQTAQEGGVSGGHSPLSAGSAVATGDWSRRARPTGSFVSGALRVTASTLAEVFEILAFGTSNRATGATNVHQHSSRSHSVFTVFNHRTSSKLHIVDLAGSERNKKTQNVGQRLQESIAINGGLLALGNVIRALSRNHNQASDQLSNAAAGTSLNGATAAAVAPATSHVPYRSSKLTRLLQDALGGSGKTLFITCVAPDSYNQEETLRSLQYSALAMKVMNAPIVQFERLHARQRGSRRGLSGVSRNGDNVEGEQDAGSSSLSPRSPDSACSPQCQQQQQQLDMLRQFCEEQEAEILAMREKLTDCTSKLQLCEEELRKDEAIFSRQIVEMERLVQENKQLRKALAEKTRGEQRQQEQYKELLNLAGDHGGGAEHAAVGASRWTDAAVGRRSTEADKSTDPLSEDIPPLQKTLPYLRKTLMFSDGAASPLSSGNASANTSRWLADRAVARANEDQLRFSEREGDCDEQMLALTKQALHYQRANTQLRHELSAVKMAMETQKRDAAMLRLELDDLHQLLR